MSQRGEEILESVPERWPFTYRSVFLTSGPSPVRLVPAERRVKANQYKVFPICRLYPAVKQNDDLHKSEVTLWPLQSQPVLTPVGKFSIIALSYQNTKYLLEERRAPLQERPRDLENQCQGAARLLAHTNTAINSTRTFIFSTRKFTPAVYVQL